MNHSRLAKMNRQSGVSLIESLVALVVLALGVMGLAGLQTRLLVETRTANSRAIAIGLIDDLANRMIQNRLAAIGKPLMIAPAAPVNSAYLLKLGTIPGETSTDCTKNNCTASEMAVFDIKTWHNSVLAAFPGGTAAIFVATNKQQIGILIGWPLNERKSDAAYNEQFTLTNTAHGVTCPFGLICHLVYVQP